MVDIAEVCYNIQGDIGLCGSVSQKGKDFLTLAIFYEYRAQIKFKIAKYIKPCKKVLF